MEITQFVAMLYMLYTLLHHIDANFLVVTFERVQTLFRIINNFFYPRISFILYLYCLSLLTSLDFSIIHKKAQNFCSNAHYIHHHRCFYDHFWRQQTIFHSQFRWTRDSLTLFENLLLLKVFLNMYSSQLKHENIVFPQ